MPKYYLAIDIGASSGRHIVGWTEGGELKTVASFNMVMNGKSVTDMVDGTECPKEQYVSRWKEYYNGDVSYDGGMYRNTDENVVGLFGVAPLEPAE